MSTKGPNTSLGLHGCTVEDFAAFDQTNVQPFQTPKVQPQFDKTGYTYMNPAVLESSGRSDYWPVKCPNNEPACGPVVYASTDPRLIDVARSLAITLDRPPVTDNVRLDEIYTREDLKGYGQNYKDYKDINAGQILYYNDKSIEDPFITPLFGTQANATGYMYQDPMGGLKPHYERKPFTSHNPLNTKNTNYTGNLSFISDTNAHREDLLAHGLWRRNQQAYNTRWAK